MPNSMRWGSLDTQIEDNTEALDLADKLPEEVIRQRVEALSSIADEMVSLRATGRIGELGPGTY